MLTPPIGQIDNDFGNASQLSDITELSPKNSVHATVEDLLGPDPVAVDELVRQCHVSAAAVRAVLLELELAGRLERHAGNRVSLLLTNRPHGS